jgi:uncharacterized protein YdaU (DUF1376 family)
MHYYQFHIGDYASHTGNLGTDGIFYKEARYA